MTIQDYVGDRRGRVELELDRLLPAANVPPSTIHAAMRHSLFAGGKRLRPVLSIAAAEACGRPFGSVSAACALECIHTYSLIHDDLPALDNDDLRRGKPTCHKVFGESIAILAGDALLTAAFRILAQLVEPSRMRVELIAELAAAAGTVRGMVGGQVADIEAEGSPPNARDVNYIHLAKTAALIRASARFGAICANGSHDQYEALSKFGRKIGLAFQIVDDILDLVSSSAALGKTAGKDVSQNKATYPALYGVKGSWRRAGRYLDEALQALDEFGDEAWALRSIANLVVNRSN